MAIALLVVGVTLVGESLNDVLNPLLRTRKLRKSCCPAPEGQQVSIDLGRLPHEPERGARRPRPAGLVPGPQAPVQAVDGVSFTLRPARCSDWSVSPVAASRPWAAG